MTSYELRPLECHYFRGPQLLNRRISIMKEPPLRTFRERQQTVIPLAVSVGSDVLAVWPVNHADIAAIAVDKRVERVRSDRLDYLRSGPLPPVSLGIWISEMRDPFILEFRRKLA